MSRANHLDSALDSEPFQFELRTIFIMTAIAGVCMALVTLIGWLAAPIDAIVLGFALWTAGNLRGSSRRLLRRLADGANWIDGLRDCRLIGAAEAAVLRAATDVDNRPWAMRELAASAERRDLYRRQMLLEIGAPLSVLCLGVLVLAVVAACFLPLVDMIQGVGTSILGGAY